MNSRLVKKSILSLVIVTILVLSLVGGVFSQEAPLFEETEGCSGFMYVGRNTVTGKTSDSSARVLSIIIEVDEETGIKTISPQRTTSTRPRFNSCGVYTGGFARSAKPNAVVGSGVAFIDANEGYYIETGYWKEDYPDLVRPDRDSAFRRATSAKEAVEMATEGMPEGTYFVHGPIVDTTLSYANTHLYKPFLKYIADPLYSLNRQERVQELLDLRRGEQINTLYAFEILRDRRYENEYSRASDNSGNIARFGQVSRTTTSLVGELPSKYVDLLSILWLAVNYPPTTPHIPFYIGIPKIPPTFADGPDNEINVLHQLFNAVSWNMEYMDEVQKFWEAFEFQTVGEKYRVEEEVKKLADAGSREAAESVLYDFVNERCESAIAYAKEMIQLIVDGKSIKEIKEDVSFPVYY